MKLSDIEIGQCLAYYPPKIDKKDNRHPTVTVTGIGKRGKVTIEYRDRAVFDEATGMGAVVSRSVRASSLAPQSELPL